MPLRMKKISTKDFLAMENPEKILAYQPATGSLLKLEMVNQTLEQRNEMLSQNLAGTISDDELGNATVSLRDIYDDVMHFDIPVRDIEFYQIVFYTSEGREPRRQKKPDIPPEVRSELENTDWLG